jgi:hypothetical protein
MSKPLQSKENAMPLNQNEPETINHPPHYQAVSGIGAPILRILGLGSETLALECIETIEILEFESQWSFCLLNAVKYLWRVGLKGDTIEDLKKAKWYLERWKSKGDGRACRFLSRVDDAIAVIDGFIDHPGVLEE